MKVKRAKKLLCEYCRKLYSKGHMPGIDGNVSIRVGRSTVVVTPSGMSKEAIMPKHAVGINLSGDVLSGTRKPSCETPMHLAAYAHSPGTGAVIHAHSPNITAFALAGKRIDTRCAPFAYMHLGIIGDIGYSAPGSAKLHESVAAELKKGCGVILLESHGVLVLGTDIADAYAKLDLLESYAKTLVYAELIGGAAVLSDKQLEEVTLG